MTGILTLLDQPRTLDALARPTSAIIAFYLTGTTTLANIYSDPGLTIPAANPVTLSSGQLFPEIFLDPSIVYRRKITYGDGSIHDVDPFTTGFNADSVIFNQAGVGATERSVESRLRETISVKDFDATGDGITDDTAFIQAAINAAIANSFSELHFPARSSGNYYKVTSPLVISEPISIRGAGKEAVVIMGVGMSAGEYIFDFDCAAVDSVDHISISGLTIRSLDGVPNGIRMKNVAYVDCSDVNLFNVYDGITFDGTRCFSHNYDNISPVQIGRNTIRWPAAFNGGGHFAFNGSTFSGDVGMAVVAGAIIDGISLTSINFEQCDTHAAVINGTVAGLSISGCRTEANDSTDFVFAPTGANEYIGGLSITGSIFLASDAGAATRIYLGGGSGKVRGFNVSGNVVTHPTNTFAGKLVELQANAESGVISGNFLRGTDASGAVIINTPTAGVTVFSNENLTGKLPEYWGTATWGVAEGTWTPIDSSGATLSFAAASGRYTKIGRHVFWQAFVTYPATANGSNAVIGGLPFSVGGLSGNSEGRAGGHVDVSNLGSVAGILQGAAGATTISIVNPQTNASLTNANVSGKSFYLSGSYSL